MRWREEGGMRGEMEEEGGMRGEMEEEGGREIKHSCTSVGQRSGLCRSQLQDLWIKSHDLSCMHTS